MTDTAKHGKDKARHALYLLKWCRYVPATTQNATNAKLKPLARGFYEY